jgi:hypothetical protein
VWRARAIENTTCEMMVTMMMMTTMKKMVDVVEGGCEEKMSEDRNK